MDAEQELFLLYSNSHFWAQPMFTYNYGGKVISQNLHAICTLYSVIRALSLWYVFPLYSAQGTTSDHHCPKPTRLIILTLDMG